ncbi:MAG: hypothetical protein D6737_06395 [Chloroflexi bacterium]|nr:MAG: hypothetical protein D6737_06395 [Chloroflexota bacterium]
MPIYKTARFQVREDAIEIAKVAIETFVATVKAKEPKTLYYTSWQERDGPSRFLHHFAFEDEVAEQFHRETEWVQEFVSILYPTLVSDGVEFIDYIAVATTQR